jgi:hypothetical protein
MGHFSTKIHFRSDIRIKSTATVTHFYLCLATTKRTGLQFFAHVCSFPLSPLSKKATFCSYAFASSLFSKDLHHHTSCLPSHIVDMFPDVNLISVAVHCAFSLQNLQSKQEQVICVMSAPSYCDLSLVFRAQNRGNSQTDHRNNNQKFTVHGFMPMCAKVETCANSRQKC